MHCRGARKGGLVLKRLSPTVNHSEVLKMGRPHQITRALSEEKRREGGSNTLDRRTKDPEARNNTTFS
jgi:hypothetical protein